MTYNYFSLSLSLKLFCGNIPNDVFESDLIPLFEKVGTLWEMRLMMDPSTQLNKGYAFVTYTNTNDALEAVRQVSSETLPVAPGAFCGFRLGSRRELQGERDSGDDF